MDSNDSPKKGFLDQIELLELRILLAENNITTAMALSANSASPKAAHKIIEEEKLKIVMLNEKLKKFKEKFDQM